jgi:hypothetical protein
MRDYQGEGGLSSSEALAAKRAGVMESLKDCPFCGGGAELRRVGNQYTKSRKAQVHCKTFGCCCEQTVGAIRQSMEWREAKVVEKWNTRAAPLDETMTQSVA